MKTTITIPENYHKTLRKMSIDRSVTLTDLVAEAIRKTFFSTSGKTNEAPLDLNFPLNQLHGMLKGSRASERQISNLKKIWNKK